MNNFSFNHRPIKNLLPLSVLVFLGISQAYADDENWNLISRTILPVNYQIYNEGGRDDDWGVGDIVQSLFFSPSKTSDSGITWG